MRTAMLITHLLGLTLGLGSVFIFMFSGMISSKLQKSEAREFTLHTYRLSTMGHIGLTLSIISGLYLMTPYWAGLSSMPLLISKLVFVGLFTTSISLMSVAQIRAKRGKGDSWILKARRWSAIALLSGLVVLVLAVVVFG